MNNVNFNTKHYGLVTYEAFNNHNDTKNTINRQII